MIDSVPLTVIGRLPGSQQDALSTVSGAIRLENGDIIVSDLGTGEVKRYGPDGRFLATMGRTGRGPQEFQAPGPPKLFGGDSIAIVDLDQRRVTIFDPAGRPAGTRLFMLVSGAPVLPLAVVAGGAFVGTQWRQEWPSRPGERSQSTVTLVAGRFGAATFDTLITNLHDELCGGLWSEGDRTGKVHSAVVGYRVKFGGTVAVAAGRRHLYVGETSRASVRVLSLEGHAIGTLTWQAKPDTIRSADVDSLIRLEAAQANQQPTTHPEQTGSLIDYLRADGCTARLAPAFTGLTPTDDGGVWVELDPRPWLPQRSFVVFDSTLAAVAGASVPRAFMPLYISGGLVVGRWRDSSGEEQVRVHRIVAGASRP
ncbi:MAG: hypothetical protein AB7L66_22540 [Gemmatimonadales bacterium]